MSLIQTAENPYSAGVLSDDLIIQAAGVQKIYHTGVVSVPALRGWILMYSAGRWWLSWGRPVVERPRC